MADDDDFAPSQTSGYKVGEKKSIDEYKRLDAHDESLNKWKENLGLDKLTGASNGPQVIILQIALEVEGREDVVLDLSSQEALERVKPKPFTIKEGVEYRMKVKFRIQDDVVSGLKYLQVVKKKGS